MQISIIIPTYNRSDRLEACLRSLQSLSVPKQTQVELTIIDNNSTDNTREIVEAILPDLPFPGRCIPCTIQGTAAARNAGIKASSGDIFMFTDEDCVPDKNWLTEACRLFESDQDLAMFSGRVELYNPNDFPQSVLTRKDFQVLDSVGKIHSFVLGCNLSIRRSVLEQIGAFDARYGAGTHFHAGEDTDIMYRAYKAGFRVVYSPDVIVYHNHGRDQISQIKDLRKRYEIGRGAFYMKHLLLRDWTIFRILKFQLYPPLRKLKRGPNRFSVIIEYLKYLYECLRLIQGAFRYVRYYGVRRVPSS